MGRASFSELPRLIEQNYEIIFREILNVVAVVL